MLAQKVPESLIDEMAVHYYHLHQNPELSLQESATADYLRKLTEKFGYTTTGPFGGHGFAALMKNGDGPVVWVRTDMDALPVNELTNVGFASKATAVLDNGTEVPVMHACGHDMHMTCWLGTAKLMSSIIDHWKGTVVFISQPAEEFGDGARKMIDDGLFGKLPTPDFVLALHVSATLEAGTIGYTSGYAYANVDAMELTVYGSGGHGAYPHTTNDPVVLAAKIVLGLQTLVSREFSPLEPIVITVGAIDGGTKANIIPDEVQLQMTIRYHNESLRPDIIEAITRLTEGIAQSAGIPPEKYPRLSYYPENLPGVYNDPYLTERLNNSWSKTLGSDRVKKVLASMGGEDFGRYGTTEHHVPICIYWLGTVGPLQFNKFENGETKLPSLHSSQFLPETKPTLATGIESMSIALMELLQ